MTHNYNLQIPKANETAILENIDTSSWSDEFVSYMLKYAWGVRMQRSTASVEPKDQLKKRQEVWDSMKVGEVPEMGSGGGARLSPESAGWVAYFTSKDSLVRFKGEVCNGKNLLKYKMSYVEKVMQDQVREFFIAEKMTVEAQIAWRKEELPDLLKQASPEVLKEAEAGTEAGSPGWYIEKERIKAMPKATEAKTKIKLFGKLPVK